MAFTADFLALLFIAIFVCGSLSDAACPADKNLDWSYNDKLTNGPEYWGETFPNCYGKQQSPINIITLNVENDNSLRKLALSNYDKPVTYYLIENNGYTVKVTPEDKTERSVVVNGEKYVLTQMHFHWGDKYYRGSEHTVDNEQYALELHLVHANKDGKIAVVAVFYQSSIFDSSGFKPVVDNLKDISYKGDQLYSKEAIDLSKLVKNGCSFYRYYGSLTTPGCNEGVIWSICKTPITMGYNQLNKFRSLYNSARSENEDITDCKLKNNFRPTQPINRRKVSSST